MSDRHVVQKKFNVLLEEYRTEILPEVETRWSRLSEEEKESLSTLNNFFCGMHLVVGLADTAASTLMEWEDLQFKEPVGAAAAIRGAIALSKESGTVRLIHIACKAFQKRGCEKSGVYIHFSIFLKSCGVTRVRLATFKGNRFNILFYDAGALYYIADKAKDFLTYVWENPNRLLRAVLEDLKVSEFLAGCRALGLISMIITSPLWRVLESDISILDMNEKYSHMIQL